MEVQKKEGLVRVSPPRKGSLGWAVTKESDRSGRPR